MTDTPRSSLYAATDILLTSRQGVTLADWLAFEVPRREAINPRNEPDWRTLAADLTELTGGKVSHETVRRWWNELQKASA